MSLKAKIIWPLQPNWKQLLLLARLLLDQSVATTKTKKKEVRRQRRVPLNHRSSTNTSRLLLKLLRRFFAGVSTSARLLFGCLSVWAECLLQELNTCLAAVLGAQVPPPYRNPRPFLQANTQTHSCRCGEPWISRGKQTLRNALSAPSRLRPLLNSTSVLRKQAGASLGEW